MKGPGLWGIACTTALVFQSSSFARADFPTVDAALARGLIRQLDDERFPVRQEADQRLRQLGIGVAPYLREALAAKPALEVYRRLEAIDNDLVRIPWRNDVEAALHEAARSHKPLFIFSTLGRPDGTGALVSRALLSRTFADPVLAHYLCANFIPVWHDQLPSHWYDLDTQQQVGPIDFTSAQLADYAQGRGASIARGYFCAPNGRLLHTMEGFWNAEQYLGEARLVLAERTTEQRGHQLRQRAEALVRQQQAEAPDEAARLEALAHTLSLSAAVLDQPLKPVHEKHTFDNTCQLFH